jgi:GTPase SAR1 family protein
VIKTTVLTLLRIIGFVFIMRYTRNSIHFLDNKTKMAPLSKIDISHFELILFDTLQLESYNILIKSFTYNLSMVIFVFHHYI